MPVVGVLVEAQVGDEHHGVAELVTKLPQRHLGDAVGVPRLRTDGVLSGREAEQHDGGHAEGAQPAGLFHQ